MFSFNEKGGTGAWGLIASAPPNAIVPQVIGVIEYNQDANVTFTCKIPVENLAGDLLAFIVGCDGDPFIVAGLPAGWTQFPRVVHPSGGNGTTLLTAWKRSDGTETDFTLTLDSRERIAGHTINIRRHHPTQDPESPVGVTGTSSAADPPSITPSWGQDNNLYLAMTSCDSGNLTSITEPAGYEQYGFSVAPSGTSGCASCVNGLALFDSTSEDPGAMTPNFATEWAANVMAIRGKAGASPGSNILITGGSAKDPRVDDPLLTADGDFFFTG